MTLNVKELSKALYEAVLSFFNDDTTYYAASLSFFTIFALLPIMALLIVLGSSLDFFNQYIDLLMKYIIDTLNPTHSENFIQLIKNFLSNTNELGYIGFIYILFVFTMFFNDYEYIVNKIHQTKKRPLLKAFFIYLILLTLLPIMFGILKIILSLYSNKIFETVITFILSWILLIIIFKVSINKKTTFRPLITSSLLTIISLSITKNMFIPADINLSTG